MPAIRVAQTEQLARSVLEDDAIGGLHVGLHLSATGLGCAHFLTWLEISTPGAVAVPLRGATVEDDKNLQRLNPSGQCKLTRRRHGFECRFKESDIQARQAHMVLDVGTTTMRRTISLHDGLIRCGHSLAFSPCLRKPFAVHLECIGDGSLIQRSRCTGRLCRRQG